MKQDLISLIKTRKDKKMKTPHIPISWGELFDKITILEIKLENLKEKNALKNVKTEFDHLFSIFEKFF